jgi:DNA-binding NarL/FixJ family response regulator
MELLDVAEKMESMPIKNTFLDQNQNKLISEMDAATVKELRDILRENGYCEIFDGFIRVMLESKKEDVDTGILSRMNDETWRLLKEVLFLYKYDLTKSQLETLKLIAEPKSNKTIAAELNVSEDAIKKRNQTIFRNLNVKNRHEASLVAFQEGIVQIPPSGK